MPLNLFLQVEAEPCPWVLHQDTELGWLVTMVKQHYFVFTVEPLLLCTPPMCIHSSLSFITLWLSVYALYWVLDCRNRIPETRWLTQNKWIFSQSGGWTSKTKVPGSVFGKMSPLGLQMAGTLLCPHGFSSAHALRARKFQISSSSKWKVKVKVAQLCPTLCDPMDYRVHGIL